MRQMTLLAGLSVIAWAIAILFFVLFGQWVVLGAQEPSFGAMFFLLLMLSLLLLIGLAVLIRLKWFTERGSATRFGTIHAFIGLLLGTFTLLYRNDVLPALTEAQHHSYAIWLTATCALTLVVPAIVDQLIRQKSVAQDSIQSAEHSTAQTGDHIAGTVVSVGGESAETVTTHESETADAGLDESAAERKDTRSAE